MRNVPPKMSRRFSIYPGPLRHLFLPRFTMVFWRPSRPGAGNRHGAGGEEGGAGSKARSGQARRVGARRPRRNWKNRPRASRTRPRSSRRLSNRCWGNPSRPRPRIRPNRSKEAKEAAKVFEDYRKNMRQLMDQAAAVAKEARKAEQEALESEKSGDKGTARLEKRRGETDNGRELPLAGARRKRRGAVNRQGLGRGALRHRGQAYRARRRAVCHAQPAPQGCVECVQGSAAGVRGDVGAQDKGRSEGASVAQKAPRPRSQGGGFARKNSAEIFQQPINQPRPTA
jgi:hypothetical protein